MSDEETIADILGDCIDLIEQIAGRPLPPEEIARRLVAVLREGEPRAELT
jgi:hypothetical protein